MSTPSREHTEKKYRAGRAMALYADWLEESNEKLETVIGLMPGSDHVYDWMGGGVATVRDMLRPLAPEAREQARLWLAVAHADAESRLSAAHCSALDALDTGAIRPDQQREYEDAYLAGKRVGPDDHAETQKTLAHLRETEELQQHEPVERALSAGRALTLPAVSGLPSLVSSGATLPEPEEG